MKKNILFLKRVIDFLVSLISVLILMPLMLIIAILIKLQSNGPVFFTQTRVGKLGTFFKIYKFRTMHIGAGEVRNGLQVSSGDPRITKLGTLLRKTSLDELPQLFNVLKGDISIVGPRPALPEQLHYYSDYQMTRLKMRPGITGWATVNGRCSIPWSERIALDIFYIENFSLWLDAKIVIRTFSVVLLGQNTYYDSKNAPAFDLCDPFDLPQSGIIKVKDKKDGNR